MAAFTPHQTLNLDGVTSRGTDASQGPRQAIAADSGKQIKEGALGRGFDGFDPGIGRHPHSGLGSFRQRAHSGRVPLLFDRLGHLRCTGWQRTEIGAKHDGVEDERCKRRHPPPPVPRKRILGQVDDQAERRLRAAEGHRRRNGARRPSLLLEPCFAQVAALLGHCSAETRL